MNNDICVRKNIYFLDKIRQKRSKCFVATNRLPKHFLLYKTCFEMKILIWHFIMIFNLESNFCLMPCLQKCVSDLKISSFQIARIMELIWELRNAKSIRFNSTGDWFFEDESKLKMSFEIYPHSRNNITANIPFGIVQLSV